MYFHFAPMRLRADSIIEAGNFGRVLRATYGNNVVPSMLLRELIFENIRLAAFPDLPSRLSAAFACPTLADAERYRAANDVKLRQVLHSVEAVDAEAAMHIAGLSWLDGQQDPYLPGVEAAATRYWQADAGNVERGQEIITASAWRVLECLE